MARHFMSLLGFALLAFSHSAHAKVVDLSNMSEASGTYDVSFCARPSPGALGMPGHMFVAFSHQRPDGKRDFLAIGHTVASDVTPIQAGMSFLGQPVDGLLEEERYTSIKQSCLVVKVNSADFNQAKALAQPVLADLGISTTETVFESYRLGSNDCISFLTDVAKTLEDNGLKVPDRATADTPMRYAEKLIAAN